MVWVICVIFFIIDRFGKCSIMFVFILVFILVGYVVK